MITFCDSSDLLIPEGKLMITAQDDKKHAIALWKMGRISYKVDQTLNG